MADRCPVCKGVGKVTVIDQTGTTPFVQVKCDACNGIGTADAWAKVAGEQALADYEAGRTVPWEEVKAQRNAE